MKILITGANGLVGAACVEHCRALGDVVAAKTREELDIADAAETLLQISEFKPDSVINCAAWTDVDGCETDKAKNFAANARGVENLAKACRQFKANLVTISTDYVFDGAKTDFYTQRDDTNPQSEYGKAKLAGEHFALQTLGRAIVVRSGWIFGVRGRNFLSKMPELLRAGKSIKAIADATGTPTFAPHLAARLREFAELDLPGIYHVTNAGDGTTYADFARSVPNVNADLIETVGFADLQRPAPRPQNSKLRCLLSEKIGLAPLPDWKTALAEFLEQMPK